MLTQIYSRILQRLSYCAPGGYTIRPKFQSLRGVNIGRNVWISQFVYFDEIHPEAITVGDNSSVGIRTSIITHLYWGARKKSNAFKKVIIGKNCFIGPHCLILPGVNIGDGSVIKGGSVLTRNVPPNTFWGHPDGGPIAKVTIPLTPESSYRQFAQGLRPIRKKSIKSRDSPHM